MDIIDVMESALKEAGRSLEGNRDELRAYATAQVAQLALAAGEPGYDLAVRAARDNIALKLGLAAVEAADAADQRIIGVLQGALFVMGGA